MASNTTTSAASPASHTSASSSPSSSSSHRGRRRASLNDVNVANYARAAEALRAAQATEPASPHSASEAGTPLAAAPYDKLLAGARAGRRGSAVPTSSPRGSRLSNLRSGGADSGGKGGYRRASVAGTDRKRLLAQLTKARGSSAADSESFLKKLARPPSPLRGRKSIESASAIMADSPSASTAVAPPPAPANSSSSSSSNNSSSGNGSAPAAPPPAPEPAKKKRPTRRESVALAQAAVSLTRLYTDRVKQFKAERERAASGASRGSLSLPLPTGASRASAGGGAGAGAGASAETGTGGGAGAGGGAAASPPETPVVIDAGPGVNVLPRGAYTVETKIGTVQIGCPPETVKDHMLMGQTIPTYYVVPQQRFDTRTFVNLAEIEFPTFFNFFVLKKRVQFITTAAGAKSLYKSFREGLLGPEGPIDNQDEFDVSVADSIRPDLRKEMDWFSRSPTKPGEHMTVETLMEFIVFQEPGDDDEGSDPWVDLGDGVKIFMVCDPVTNEITYRFEQDGAVLATVPDVIRPPDLSKDVSKLFQPFQPPQFGFTFLGTSHGFDPAGQTTGFVLWINGQGVMVDPPPNSSVLLQMMGIPPRLIDTIVLTHCHADHDAGTLQKVLEEGQVTIMATPTIIGSFVVKYSALTGIEEAMLRQLFRFRPVRIGAFMPYRSAHFRFFYALHSVPCTGFEVYCGGQSMVYSADTFNDPAGIEKMHQAGVLSAGRRDALINFPWHHTVVLHEAGVPPIHTPTSYLASLPDDVKRRVRLVHVAAKSVPRAKGLQLAREGPEHTIRIPVELPPLAQSVNALDLVSYVRFLQNLPLADARLLLQMGYVRTFGPGKPITVRHAGSKVISKHNEFFIIASGIVRVEVVGGAAAAAAAAAAATAGGARAGAASSGGGSGGGGGKGGAKGSSEAQELSYATIGEYFPTGVLRVRPDSDSSAATRTTKLVATAQTTVQCVVFNELEFWNFLVHAGVLSTASETAAYTESAVPLMRNSVFAKLTERQQKQLRTQFRRVTLAKGEAVWKVGERAALAFLVSSGSCSLAETGSFDASQSARSHGAGAFFAEVPAMRSGSVHTTTVVASTPCTGFAIDCGPFMAYLRHNPSLLLHLADKLLTY